MSSILSYVENGFSLDLFYSTATRIPPGQNIKTRPRDYRKWIRSVRFTALGLEKKELSRFDAFGWISDISDISRIWQMYGM